MKNRLLSSLLSALVVATAALAAPFVSAAPAQAACTGSGPYWFANVASTANAGARKVLAVESPWTTGSRAYIWGYNNDNRQKWCLEFIQYNIVDDVNVYRFRYANNNSLCLNQMGTADGSRLNLQPCSNTAYQYFEQFKTGTYRDPNGTNYQTYKFVTMVTERCLDSDHGGSSDGTKVHLWSCSGSNNQRWY